MEPQGAKRIKRQSTKDFIMSQKSLRRSSSAAGVDLPAPPSVRSLVRGESLPADGACDSSAAAPGFLDQSIFEQVSALQAETIESADTCFDLADQGRTRLLERAASLKQEEERLQVVQERVLTSVDDLNSDISLKSTLQLTTSGHSFKWLWRLPAALRAQHPKRTSDSANEAIIDLCRECLPGLANAPERATKWMERIVACLAWYEIEGPARPTEPNAPENADAWRRVREWDEGFRSLETLLRQGLISSFAIVAERFTITVLGDGMGPFKQEGTGVVRQPSCKHPCAVLCPSFSEFRDMLQENHVPFEVAEFHADAAPPLVTSSDALVSRQLKREATREDDIHSLRELRRDGIKIVPPEEAGGAGLLTSTALWFEGAWRVHALLDVLRQHVLAAPLNAAAKPPPRLPRLVASAPFCHAVTRTAEVQSTHTAPAAPHATSNPPTNAGGTAAQVHTAQLTGYFFPGQVKKLLELLRVLLPSFSCSLVAAEPRGSIGVNAFTALGNHRVESVSCDRLCAGDGQSVEWKWALRLGA